MFNFAFTSSWSRKGSSKFLLDGHVAFVDKVVAAKETNGKTTHTLLLEGYCESPGDSKELNVQMHSASYQRTARET